MSNISSNIVHFDNITVQKLFLDIFYKYCRIYLFVLIQEKVVIVYMDDFKKILKVAEY